MRIEISEAIQPLNLPSVAQSLEYTCGAACFASMYQFLTGEFVDEMRFAKELDTIQMGYTLPINIVNLAKAYGFMCDMTEGADIQQLINPLSCGEVIFVTWWKEDAGHYSLVNHLECDHITLMDPWCALNTNNRLPLHEFIPHWQVRGSRMIRVALK